MKIFKHPILLSTRHNADKVRHALSACEEREKIPECVLNELSISPIQVSTDMHGEVVEGDITIGAKRILETLGRARDAAFLDVHALGSSLRVAAGMTKPVGMNGHRIDDYEMLVYDPLAPKRATVVEGLLNAEQQLEKYKETRSLVFITVEGHAFNLSEKYTNSLKEPRVRFLYENNVRPTIDNIVEVKPEELGSEILSWMRSGKVVVVDSEMFNLRPELFNLQRVLTPEDIDRFYMI